MKRTNRLIVLGTFAIAAVATLASPAVAGPPVGGCPPAHGNAPQWELVTVRSLEDAGLIVAGAQGVDLNGNGLTCAVFPPNQVLPTIRDDTVPSSAL